MLANLKNVKLLPFKIKAYTFITHDMEGENFVTQMGHLIADPYPPYLFCFRQFYSFPTQALNCPKNLRLSSSGLERNWAEAKRTCRPVLNRMARRSSFKQELHIQTLIKVEKKNVSLPATILTSVIFDNKLNIV